MAGGVGSRFWPLSRAVHPKQFIDILGSGKTLLQQTFDRFKTICPRENIYVVTHESYTGLVKQQIPGIADSHVLGEPLRRNTAPCIAYATFKIASENPDACIVVAPSDHVITRDDIFSDTINNALRFTAGNDCLLTLGIRPSRPDTGYGYIQFVDDKDENEFKVKKVKTFTEKPNLEMAKFFLRSGEFLWNSGIFIFNQKSIRKSFEMYLPEIHSLFSEGEGIYNSPGESAFIKKQYGQCTNISIDYGIMEKAKNVFVLSSDFGWSDLGTWGSLYEHRSRDGSGNAIVGSGVLVYDSKNKMASPESQKKGGRPGVFVGHSY